MIIIQARDRSKEELGWDLVKDNGPNKEKHILATIYGPKKWAEVLLPIVTMLEELKMYDNLTKIIEDKEREEFWKGWKHTVKHRD